jgi:hypothetical protein
VGFLRVRQRQRERRGFCVKAKSKKPIAHRVQFADGSALVTYPDGSMLILESDLARESVLQ